MRRQQGHTSWIIEAASKYPNVTIVFRNEHTADIWKKEYRKKNYEYASIEGNPTPVFMGFSEYKYRQPDIMGPVIFDNSTIRALSAGDIR